MKSQQRFFSDQFTYYSFVSFFYSKNSPRSGGSSNMVSTSFHVFLKWDIQGTGFDLAHNPSSKRVHVYNLRAEEIIRFTYKNLSFLRI